MEISSVEKELQNFAREHSNIECIVYAEVEGRKIYALIRHASYNREFEDKVTQLDMILFPGKDCKLITLPMIPTGHVIRFVYKKDL